LISPNWQGEFHVHTNASLLDVGVMLFHNVTTTSDQPIVYAYRLLTQQNYSITNIMALAMVLDLHKFRHYLLGNKFVF